MSYTIWKGDPWSSSWRTWFGYYDNQRLKCSKQCLNAAKAANKILGMIKRTFTCKSEEIIFQLYKSLIRPRLEYCIQAWCPHLRKDIGLLEKVQRRATRLIYSLHDLPYYDRLKIFKLTTLVTRRVRGDLIEVFRIINAFEEVDFNISLKIASSTNLRGHSLKLYKHNLRLDTRKYFFSQRVIDMWNKLDTDVIACRRVTIFKKYLENYIFNQGLI